jgi:hypothetical protein
MLPDTGYTDPGEPGSPVPRQEQINPNKAPNSAHARRCRRTRRRPTQGLTYPRKPRFAPGCAGHLAKVTYLRQADEIAE